ncbi:thymidine phosphorylase [Anaerotignum sp. MSJ-24]|uniref:thymidine phosphorylase n=1 Tax=Anaerotignum sp. MSJ-24 TaxID=2841521 RepID=UPI001C11359E|nr:thymidine phosphorylase [Anaerotignum sp. MSJ-24]MBU5465118.1 thymidine phosphorylase [Anaerotignum sp. MSJ-24]
MNIVDLIIKKRDGGKLTKEEIEFFIKGVTDSSIPDYQVSAMLMAIYFQDLDNEETSELTMAMAHSGGTFDLSSVEGIKVDKHSTGGVADTTTLILAPLVASCGVPVIKMSGRGLGFSGGTLDKLESIPGFKIDVTEEQALEYAKTSGIVLMSQTDNLTPADKKLYALRDVTGTVDNLALISGSIMSKKIAAGADAIVLDVKCGSGAFMKDYPSAVKLAKTMAEIGKSVGRNVTAVISSMDQPLGMNIGNSLEVIEAIEVLKGNVKGDLLDVALTLGAYMLIGAKKVNSVEEGISMLTENINNGKGLAKFRELLIQQHGNPDIIEDYSLLPLSKAKLEVRADSDGYIYSMNTAEIGRSSLETGAGRASKTDSIDFGSGIIMKVRIGDTVSKGDVIAEIYSATEEKCISAGKYLKDAIEIKAEKPEQPKLILDIIS